MTDPNQIDDQAVPVTPEPVTPEPATPEPATPEPATPEPERHPLTPAPDPPPPDPSAEDLVQIPPLPRDQVAMMYHAIFYLTNLEQPLPAGHPPTHAMLAQLALADALGVDHSDVHLQNVERALASARQAQAQRQVQLEHARAADGKQVPARTTPPAP